MSDFINDGGPAFPVPVAPAPDGGWVSCKEVEGMSLRDWFAGQVPALDDDISFDTISALTGLPVPHVRQEGESSGSLYARNIRWLSEANARYRYMQADAMLAARRVKP